MVRREKSGTKYRLNFMQRFSINQNNLTMKTKTFIMVCLLSGIVLTQLSAQNAENGNGTFTDDFVWDGYYIPVFSSNGELIDWLVGSVTVHQLYHFKDGIQVWKKEFYNGEAESVGLDWVSGTGEVFLISDRVSIPLTSIPYKGVGHINAKGNMGTHYIIFYEYIFNPITWDESFSLVKAVSPGNN